MSGVVEFLAGELRTGRRLTQLPVTSGSWSQVLNGPGEISVTIPLGDTEVRTRTEILAQVEPWRCFLAAQLDGDAILEAGPIVSHEFDADTNHLTVKAMGLWSVFDHRHVVPTSGDVTKPVVFSGLSLRTIAKRVVQNSLAQPGGGLPVVLEADVTGTHERTYPGYELASSRSCLESLAQVEGGPDIAFEPRLTVDRLGIEWVMRTGAPLLKQTGDDWQLDTGAVGGRVSSVSVSVDASERANRVWAVGDGFEESTLIEPATDSTQWDRGYPLLESVLNHSTVTRRTTLRSHARAGVDQGAAPWTTWTVMVRPSGAVPRPGDWCSVHIPAGHVYLPAGAYRARIGKLAGQVGRDAWTVDLLPTKGMR